MDYELEVKQYIVRQFMPDIAVDELDADYDLIASGVIDSLSLLRVITWLGTYFEIPVDDIEITEQNFASVHAVCELIERGIHTGSPAK